MIEQFWRAPGVQPGSTHHRRVSKKHKLWSKCYRTCQTKMQSRQEVKEIRKHT